MLNFTKNLAKEAGKIPRKHWGKLKSYKYKRSRDLLTIADVETNKFIVNKVRKQYPGHSIMAEESGKIINPGGQYLWVIDPIDGTAAYSRGLPYFGTSIALFKDGQPFIGVIYDPLLDELFWAQDKKGAYFNGKKIKPSKISILSRAVIDTGFPHQRKSIQGQKQLKNTGILYNKIENFIVNTCAVSGLCYVACGRLEVYYEYILNPWDFAAGAIIVEQAGGKVTTPEGRPWTLKDKRIVASNGLIHNKFLKQLTK
ncbi:MAG: inositol monophosphatase family protein [Patescibacteria group bacterium]